MVSKLFGKPLSLLAPRFRGSKTGWPVAGKPGLHETLIYCYLKSQKKGGVVTGFFWKAAYY